MSKSQRAGQHPPWEALRRWRRDSDIRQQDAASRFGISRAQYAAYEAGITRPHYGGRIYLALSRAAGGPPPGVIDGKELQRRLLRRKP